jgi:hypothetical protein
MKLELTEECWTCSGVGVKRIWAHGHLPRQDDTCGKQGKNVWVGDEPCPTCYSTGSALSDEGREILELVRTHLPRLLKELEQKP